MWRNIIFLKEKHVEIQLNLRQIFSLTIGSLSKKCLELLKTNKMWWIFFFLRKCGIQLYLQNILNYDIWNLSKYGWNCTFRTFSDIILEIFITYCLCHTRIGKTQLVACSKLHIFDVLYKKFYNSYCKLRL